MFLSLQLYDQVIQDGLREEGRSLSTTPPRKEAGRGTTSGEADSSSEAASYQDGEREGGTEDEDEGEIREEVRHSREDPLYGA